MKPNDWQKWHNTTWKVFTGFTPNEVVYNQPPPSLLQYVPGTACVPTVRLIFMIEIAWEKSFLINSLGLETVWRHLPIVVERNGTLKWATVLLKVQPYKQLSLKSAMLQKLASKYYGPYLVTEKIGKIAYRLQLPPAAKIHDVFHVSLLKRYESNQHSICHDPPTF